MKTNRSSLFLSGVQTRCFTSFLPIFALVFQLGPPGPRGFLAPIFLPVWAARPRWRWHLWCRFQLEREQERGCAPALGSKEQLCQMFQELQQKSFGFPLKFCDTEPISLNKKKITRKAAALQKHRGSSP